MRALFEAVGPGLHILVNCAGALASTELTPDIALEDPPGARFAVNVRGTFLVLQALRCRGWGAGRRS